MKGNAEDFQAGALAIPAVPAAVLAAQRQYLLEHLPGRAGRGGMFRLTLPDNRPPLGSEA